MFVYDYYTVRIPGDMGSYTLAELGEIAINEAREKLAELAA